MHSTPQDNPGGISSWLDQPANGRQAVVDWTPEESLATLSFGFATAARELADAWPEVRNDAVVVPIVYLYRHAVELSLKGAIRDGDKVPGACGRAP